MKNLITLIFITALLVSINSCSEENRKGSGNDLLSAISSDEREPIVKAYLQQNIFSQSKGSLQLENLSKINGFDQEYMGMQLYSLEWQADISVLKGGWILWNESEIYSPFTVLFKEPNYSASYMLGNPKHFNSGSKVRLTGRTMLQKTEQGWRAIEGGKVTTWVILTESSTSGNSSSKVRDEIAGDSNTPSVNNNKNNSDTRNSSLTKTINLSLIENKYIVDTYLGTIGNKEFKLFIEKVEDETVYGYNITGSNKRSVKGRILSKWKDGDYTTVFRLILDEPGGHEWDGEFNIDLFISDQGRNGEGTWKSFNGKLEHTIVIKDRFSE